MLVVRIVIFAAPAFDTKGWHMGDPGQCRAHYEVISGVINGYIRPEEKNQLLILLIIIFIYVFYVLTN